jgi:hypothetical protein
MLMKKGMTRGIGRPCLRKPWQAGPNAEWQIGRS